MNMLMPQKGAKSMIYALVFAELSLVLGLITLAWQIATGLISAG